MQDKKHSLDREEGLPEIAQAVQKNKVAVCVMLGIVLFAAITLFLHKKSEKKSAPVIEESYAIPTENVTEIKNNVSTSSSAQSITPQQNQEVVKEQIALIQAKQQELQQRLAAPLMVVNNTTPDKTVDTEAIPHGKQIATSSHATSGITTIGPLNTLIAEGNLIHAILESATHSDLPGSLRAIVSEPVYAEDGTQLLIPRGSRLIGQYKSGMLQGQSRIFVLWTRLITPNGISIHLASAGVDPLGVAGMGADHINQHFWERFGTASLLSIIGVGAANINAPEQANSVSAYRTAVANSFAQSANQSVQQDSRMAPTLTTDQGKPIIVFVAHDLDFQAVLKQVQPKINVW